jgi:hypothetical protein
MRMKAIFYLFLVTSVGILSFFYFNPNWYIASWHPSPTIAYMKITGHEWADSHPLLVDLRVKFCKIDQYLYVIDKAKAVWFPLGRNHDFILAAYAINERELGFYIQSAVTKGTDSPSSGSFGNYFFVTQEEIVKLLNDNYDLLVKLKQISTNDHWTSQTNRGLGDSIYYRLVGSDLTRITKDELDAVARTLVW